MGDWKLIAREEAGHLSRELFNIDSDPYEQIEVSADHRDVVDDLIELMESERAEDGSSARTDVDSPMVG